MAQVTGFQSMDCGSQSNNPNYKDTDSDILWTPDSYNNMNPGGTSVTVQPPSNPPYLANIKRYTTIRYFDSPAYSKFCYILPNTTIAEFYLVRASFWLGPITPYPTVNSRQLQFTLLINADVWQNISIFLPQSSPLVLAIYVQAISTNIAVCLSGKEITGDPPFISALELRHLNDDMQFREQTQCALRQLFTTNVGPATDELPIRYKNDSLDRIWNPLSLESDLSTLSTTQIIDISSLSDLPPIPVLQTAVEPFLLENMLVYNSVDAGEHLYFYSLYFADIDPFVYAPGQRVFDIYCNGDLIVSQVDIFMQAGSYVTVEFSLTATTSLGWLNFTLSPTSSSIFSPCLSAAEIFECFDTPMSNGTFSPDVASMNNITAALSDLSSYTGDPCLPSGYGYPWVTCSLASPPRVTKISLSSRALVGEIPASFNGLTALVTILLDGNSLTGEIPDLSALTSLQVLNLSNNNLNGPIPEFFSTLPSLQYLYLQNNNLSGPIPASLLEHSFSVFNYTGNAFLCNMSNTCYKAPQKQNTKLKIDLAISGAFIFLVLVGTIILVAYKRRRHNATPSLEREHVIPQTEMVEASNSINAFSYQEIESATNNFHFKLGEGGSGEVYEGKIENGRIVAIKVLRGESQQRIRQFLNEVKLLSRVHHRNLVNLIGYCTEQKVMLVYEYMSNGSLKDLLYGKSALIGQFTWGARLRVLLDAAQGLEYLHYGCNPQIIHRDIKSSNILLNDKMEGKVADFGISRPTSENSSDVTMRVMGTFGYLDPEYSATLHLTEKADVYSFGVLMFEVICGRHPFIRNTTPSHILDWVRPSIDRGLVQDIVDRSIHEEYSMSSLWKIVKIAMMCVEYDGKKRPTMREVCLEIKEANQIEVESSRSFSKPSSDLDPSASTNVRVR